METVERPSHGDRRVRHGYKEYWHAVLEEWLTPEEFRLVTFFHRILDIELRARL